LLLKKQSFYEPVTTQLDKSLEAQASNQTHKFTLKLIFDTSLRLH